MSKHDTKTCQCVSCTLQRTAEAAFLRHCAECDWQGPTSACTFYPKQNAWECPACGSDAILYTAWKKDKEQEAKR